MDIEKLIEQMRYYGGELGATPLNNVIGKYMLQAADALAELRGEVESLKNGHCTGCSVPVIKTEQLKDLNDAPELRSENEKLRSDLRRLRTERDTLLAANQHLLAERDADRKED